MMLKTNKVILLFFIFFILAFGFTVSAEKYNKDDYDDIISYAINPKIVNRNLANQAKKYLKSDTNSIPFLINHFNTINARTLWEIKYILIDIDSPAVKPLLNYVYDTVTYGNLTAINVLGEIGDTQAVPELTKLLDSAETSVRSVSAVALGRIKSRKPVQKLIELLEDEHPMVRKSAVVALGKIVNNDKNILFKLFEKLNDKHYYVRFSAIEAIENFDTPLVYNSILDKVKLMKFKENSDYKLILQSYLRILYEKNIENYMDAYGEKIILDLFYKINDELSANYIKRLIEKSEIDSEKLKKFNKCFKEKYMLVKLDK